MLDGVKSKVTEITSKYKYTFAIFALIILLVFGVLFYKKYLKQQMTPEFVENKEFLEVIEDAPADKGISTAYFFTVEWCPYCKSAIPDWNKISDKYKTKKIHGQDVNFKLVDCSNVDDTNKAGARCENLEDYEQSLFTNNVTGYPTIIVVKGEYNENITNNIYVLQSRPTEENIENFITTVF
jgi:thiol-disulfide isomerase/thioredoxin